MHNEKKQKFQITWSQLENIITQSTFCISRNHIYPETEPNCKATTRPDYQQTFKYEHKTNSDINTS